jgi:hypothetical protein
MRLSGVFMHKTTLSVITACWGLEYGQFIPRWWEGLLSLNRKPDEIILGIVKEDPVGLADSIPTGIEAKIVVLPDLPINYKWDYAIRQSTCKWFNTVPIDDELLPGAFDEIDIADSHGAELYIDSILYRHSGRIWKGTWNTSILGSQMPAPQLIPSTKELYERLGQKMDYRWSDWIFQIDAAKAGAKPYIADTTRIIFDEGVNRVTESGVSMNQNIRRSEDLKVHKYAKDNGF